MSHKLTNDFFIDTMGNCFLCARKIAPLSQQPSPVTSWTDLMAPSNSNHSLQYLSRYLAMDLSKVFPVKGLIPQTLLSKVINSQLKVSMCGMCASLNEKFSGLCRQLEKIQLDAMHCLERVKESLEGAIESDKNRTMEVLRATNNNSEDGQWALSKMEIAEVLRKEAFEKCSRKLRRRTPRAKLQKLSSHQVNQAQIRVKSITKKTIESEPIPANLNDISPKIEIGNLKQEPPSSDLMTNENGFEDEWYEDGLENMEGDEMAIPSDPLELPDSATSQRVGTGQNRKPQQRQKHFGRKFHANKNSKTIIPKPTKLLGVMRKSKRQCRPFHRSQVAPPIKLYEKKGKPLGCQDSETGRWRCKICALEFRTGLGFTRHYKSAHNCERFKCTVCAKLFTQKVWYERHYFNFHVNA